LIFEIRIILKNSVNPVCFRLKPLSRRGHSLGELIGIALKIKQ